MAKLEQRPRRLSDEERIRIIEVLTEELRRDERVVFAYVYGSLVERESVRDVDVAVWLRRGVDSFKYMLWRSVKLEEKLGLPVDLYVLNDAPTLYRYVVYTRGVQLFVKDRLLHDLEVNATIREYWDLRLLRKTVEKLQRGTRVSGAG